MKLFLLSLLILVGARAHAAEDYQPFGAVLAELLTRNVFEINDDVIVVKDQEYLSDLIDRVKPESVPSLRFFYNSGGLTDFGNAYSEDVLLAKGLFCHRLFAPGLRKPKLLECAIGGERLRDASLAVRASRFSDMVTEVHINEMFLHLAKGNTSNIQTVLKTDRKSYNGIQIEPSPWLRHIKRAGWSTLMGAMDQVLPLSVGRDRQSLIFCETTTGRACTLIKLN